ncbi:MAG: class I SAM-dependent methyltransferase [Candidatus Limnocylindrales bacterium]
MSRRDRRGTLAGGGRGGRRGRRGYAAHDGRPLTGPTPAGPARRGPRRLALLPRLGLAPSTAEILNGFLDTALPASRGDVLDAGCGRVSALVAFRPRIARLVGVDIHAPHPPLPWLDAFQVADLCSDGDAFPATGFDLVLSSFTFEHLADAPAAMVNVRRWLRPGGTVVITTVNRDHPLVGAYLSLPARLRDPLQRFVKASAADAHPLVGTCNTPRLVRKALVDAGFGAIEVRTTGHLARAWQRRLPSYALGLLGDLAARPFPARRSTIVARASVIDC